MITPKAAKTALLPGFADSISAVLDETLIAGKEASKIEYELIGEDSLLTQSADDFDQYSTRLF